MKKPVSFDTGFFVPDGSAAKRLAPPVRSVLAVATQLEGLAGDTGVLELAEQALQPLFRQLHQAEAFAHLDATYGFAGQAALVEDGTEQVAGRHAIAQTQGGAAAHPAFGQRQRSAPLAVLATLASGALRARRTLASRGWGTGHQRLVTLDLGQGQALAVGHLAQQGRGQGTRAAADVGGQTVEQLAMAGLGLGGQRRQAVGEFPDPCVQHLLGVGQAHLGDLLPGDALDHLQHAPLARRHQQQRTAFATGAAFSGIMGAVFAAKQTFVSPESFTLQASINILAFVILGGMGSIGGAVVGAAAVTVLNIGLLKDFSDLLNTWRQTGVTILGYNMANLPPQLNPAKYERLVFGLILILMMIFRPEGLIPEQRHRAEMQEARQEAQEGGAK